MERARLRVEARSESGYTPALVLEDGRNYTFSRNTLQCSSLF